MAYLRALRDPAFALSRVRHYGFGRIVINEVKKYPVLLPLTFKALQYSKMAVDAPGYMKRRSVARALARETAYKGYFAQANGFRNAPPGTFDAVDRIVPVAQEVCRRFLELYPSGHMDESSYSYLLFNYDDPRADRHRVDLRAHPEFQALASYRPFLEIASEYLGEVPILGSINLQLVSPNEHVEGFQKFHIDGGGNAPRQMKIFIPVEDVDEGNGATVIVDADASREIVRSIGYRTGRIPDDVVLSPRWKPHVHHAAGPAGSAFFFDTCRTIHLGARARTRRRILIMLQYISKYIAAETALQRDRFDFDRERASADPVSRLLFDLD